MRDESLTNHIRDQTGNTRKIISYKYHSKKRWSCYLEMKINNFYYQDTIFCFELLTSDVFNKRIYFEQDLKYRYLIYMTAFIYIFWQYVTFSVSTRISSIPIMSILVIYISISLAKFNSIVEFDFHCVIWLMIRNCLFYEGL